MNNIVSLSEHQINEIINCSDSLNYFADNYVWIPMQERATIVPFEAHKFQRNIFKWIETKTNGVIYKDRRVGASTGVAVGGAWMLCFHPGVRLLFLSIKETDAMDLLAKVVFIVKNLAYKASKIFAKCPKANFLMPEILIENKQKLEIAWRDDRGNVVNKSVAESLTTTKKAARGKPATMIFMDELAFLDSGDEAFAAATPATTWGGFWIAASTPNTTADIFYDLVKDAELGKDISYELLEVDASDAGITQAMIKKATSGMSSEQRDREFGRKFLQSGGSVFKQDDLEDIYIDLKEDEKTLRYLKEYRSKVLNPRSEYIYYSGVDNALGKNRKTNSGDYHCFTCLTDEGVQAYCYLGQDSLSVWAGQVIDKNGIQQVMPGKVSKLHAEFPGVAYIEQNSTGHTVLAMHQIPNNGNSDVVPFHTNAKTKSILINSLIMAIESKQIKITSRDTMEQLLTFQYGSTPGTYEAAAGRNDDAVIALALAYQSYLNNAKSVISMGEEKLSTERKNYYTTANQDSSSIFEESREQDKISPPRLVFDEIYVPTRITTDRFDDGVWSEDLPTPDSLFNLDELHEINF